eukprot:Selendium_serpulae@DN10578_c0_g1_i1.p1
MACCDLKPRTRYEAICFIMGGFFGVIGISVLVCVIGRLKVLRRLWFTLCVVYLGALIALISFGIQSERPEALQESGLLMLIIPIHLVLVCTTLFIAFYLIFQGIVGLALEDLPKTEADIAPAEAPTITTPLVRE